MELWVSIALGITVANIIKGVMYQIQSVWWTFKHRNNDVSSKLDRLLFGDKFEEEELLEK